MSHQENDERLTNFVNGRNGNGRSSLQRFRSISLIIDRSVDNPENHEDHTDRKEEDRHKREWNAGIVFYIDKDARHRSNV